MVNSAYLKQLGKKMDKAKEDELIKNMDGHSEMIKNHCKWISGNQSKVEMHEQLLNAIRRTIEKQDKRLKNLEGQAFACKWISILSLIIVGVLVLIK